ncbi:MULTISPECIES: hypothetical protein [unclassified Pseudomonas]|uniref:hypothetical protein n=1 Tax=unclassified Pseudomonas TaxID=196821 RepID=UPI002AC95C9A|nr:MULTISPECIES: hypothetical protein [unclassified Pseudomonas]MEB0043002.1 hypothetical protein [Pseudomonas sp. MH10]MEB0080279.1 hypothetical protein [Pseudomonas sp. MH10out]MEB0094166.1 hypothetical protein [Pseudomonas sp. CCI4.2]MEB0103367.1 hypothetical protein [Pseudomonas sp. CCI3.2]MEB0123297.1 hypothetical protein [Pseudomonas sp. CCI1.2]
MATNDNNQNQRPPAPSRAGERNDPAIDPITPDHDLGDGQQFDEGSARTSDREQLELEKLHTAAENPFSPEADSVKDTEQERARQRREQGIETDADIDTDGG